MEPGQNTRDAEVEAIAVCVVALEALDPPVRDRVLRYVVARFPLGPVRLIRPDRTQRPRPKDGLRGDRLAEAAVEMLVADPPPNGNGIHYRDWFERVDAEHAIASMADPLAAFLTAVTRHPRVVRVDGARGRYRLQDEPA